MDLPNQSKRKLSSITRSVSPPVLRRRLLEPSSGLDKTNTSGTTIDTTQVTPASRNTNVPRPLTFYSWNVNGVSVLLQKQLTFAPNSVYPLRAFLRNHDWPDLCCLQEVKINRADVATQRRVEHAANSGQQPGQPSYRAYFSLPRDRYNATGFGGKVHGVATLVRDNVILGRTAMPEWDLEGRVLIHEFDSVVVVNGYWVNGTNNSYRDPTDGTTTGTRHNHKLRFHQEMLSLCRDVKKQGKGIILLGDMNVAPQRIDGHPNLRTSPIQHVINRNDFNEKFLGEAVEQGLSGIDLFRHFHGQEKKYTYRGRNTTWGASADRVDLIIASRDLIQARAILDCNICDTQQDRAHSDHVPLWVKIDLSRMGEQVEKLP